MAAFVTVERIELVISVLGILMSMVGKWLILQKAGKPGWHGLIPILNVYDEYSICWKGWMIFPAGILFVIGVACSPDVVGDKIIFAMVSEVALLGYLAIRFIENMRLAKAFGKRPLFGVLLFLFDRIGSLCLGLGRAEYVGKEEQPAELFMI